MPINPDMNLVLQRVEKAIVKLPIIEALNLINAEISNPSNIKYKAELEVQKAIVLWTAGSLEESVNILKRSAEENVDNVSVHYFAGEYMLQLGKYAEASDYLKKSIDIARQLNDEWFQKSAYLLRAFCYVKLGYFDLARQDIANVDDEEEITWIDVESPISKKSITDLLKKEHSR